MKLLSHVYKSLDELKQSTEFLPTGFVELDRFLDGGFMRKELVVVGGFTGSGKSFLAGQVFFNVAKHGFKSAYFSLEISNEMVVSRLIGQMANVKPSRIMCGLLTKEEYEAKKIARSKISPYESFMHFSDDIYKMAEIEQAIKANCYDFVVVDFIQNVITGEKDEYAAMSLAALEFQKMAKKYNCCILVVSQLSNAAAKTGVLEYKGSGGIAMVADLGFFIERGDDSKDEVTLGLRKNRRGVSGVKFEYRFKTPGGMIL